MLVKLGLRNLLKIESRLNHLQSSIILRSLSSSNKSQAEPDDNNDASREVELRYLDGKDNGIAVLGLRRPKARNALGVKLVEQMSEMVDHLRRDDRLRVLILRSLVPGAFSAGADLRERARMNPEETERFVDGLRDLSRDLENLSTPTIAAMDGLAFGGGLEFALACDLRTASDNVQLGLVETRLAIIPAAGGSQRLPRLIGPALAKELVFTAKVLSAQEAYDLGIVNRIVKQNDNDDAAYQEALVIARQILPNGPLAVKVAKVAISKGIEVPLEDGYQIEKQCYDKLLHTKDRIEGLAAFASKRVPVYRGL